MKIGKPESTAEALRLKAAAARKHAIAAKMAHADPTGAHWHRSEAREMERAADNALALPPEYVEVGIGGEIVPLGADAREKPGIVDTVRASPTLSTARASCERMDLAGHAGVLDLAADAAESIQAANSLEKMLAHQLAAAHALAMKLSERAMAHTRSASQDLFGPSRREYHAVEAARATNAAARMMATFQDGVLALAKLRSGGTQRVIVQHQHVTVEGGGQAVITGRLQSSTGGGGSKNER